jgi:hypothetical protein
MEPEHHPFLSTRHEPWWLSDIYFLGMVTIQECGLNVHMMNLPSMASSNYQDNSQ